MSVFPSEDEVRIQLSDLHNGIRDPGTDRILVVVPNTCEVEFRVDNATGQDATFAISIEKQFETLAGTWTVIYTGVPTTPIGSGAFVTESMTVAPAAGAFSVEVTITASATINASIVTGRLVLTFVSSD